MYLVRAFSFPLALVLLFATCSAHRVDSPPPFDPDSQSDHNFLMLMLGASARAQAMAQSCAGKHIRSDLETLCRQIISVRQHEARILTPWLSSWFGTSAPIQGQPAPPPGLLSADGQQFERAFLKRMMRQDREELRTDTACTSKATHDELIKFCELLARARTVELRLMRTQLCLWYSDCESRQEQDRGPLPPRSHVSVTGPMWLGPLDRTRLRYRLGAS